MKPILSLKLHLPIALLLSAFHAQAQDLQLLIGAEESEWGTGSSGPMPAADGGYFLRLRMQEAHSLIKLDAEGNIGWHRSHAFPDGSNAYSPGIVPTSDGGAYLLKSLLVESNNGRFSVTRIASDGAAMWSKTYSIPLAPTIDQGGTTPQALIRPDGGLDILVQMDLTGGDEYFLMRIGADGSVAWVKRAPVATTTTLNSVFHIAHDGLGGLVTFYEHNDLRSGLVSRFDDQGEHLWSRSVTMTNQWWNYSYPSLIAGDEGQIYLFGNQHVIGNESNYIYKLDPDGDLAWYRWIDQGWPMLPIYSQVGRMVEGQLQFGGSTRLVLDTDGIPLATSSVSFPTTTSGSFEWRVLPTVPHRPADRLLVAGSWSRRDITFDFEWLTPIFMNLSFTPEEWCHLDFSSGLPDHLLVPAEYLENEELPAWENATATATPVTILDTPLPLPATTPLCFAVGVEDAHASSPGMRLQPNAVGVGGTCELELGTPGTYRVFSTTGAEVVRAAELSQVHVISTQGWSPGFYIVRAEDRSGRAIGTRPLMIGRH
ncbi:MAG TPA: hypothetical protein PLN54_07580 [Flavobacteriales bacterium]|nr:hypothetical protein [Flavobacteriales bacterium]